MKPENVIAQFERAKSDRYVWNNHWQEIADFVIPSREFSGSTIRGAQKRSRIFNSTAPEAAVSLASALEGMLFNTSIRWFALGTEDESLNSDSLMQDWLYDTTSKMLAYFDNTETGFSTSAHEIALDWVSFGTGVMLLQERDDLLKYESRQLSNIYIAAGESDDITDLFREIEMPAWEVVKKFPDTASEKTRKMAEDPKKHDTAVKIIHFIFLREKRDVFKQNKTNKKWGSVYIEVDQKSLLDEGGFDENPYIISRWSRGAGEIYGRSPAMNVLPTIKVVNTMARTIIEASELAVRPPLMVAAGTIEGPIRTAPGSLIYVRQGTRDYPQPLTTGARPDVGLELMKEEEEKIQQAFFADRLRLPQNDRMTATEIIERRQQGLMVISPILSRLYAEFLNPLIQRTYNWMKKKKLLRPMPMAGSGARLKIHYVSPMAVSRKASNSQAFMQAMSVVQPLVQVDPAVMQNLDVDGIFRSIMINNNVDPSFLKSKREVEEARAAQQQQEQESMGVQDAQAGASAARDAAMAAKELGLVGQE